METNRIELPVLPLRDVVVYPHMVIPLFVGRDRSIKALDIAMAADKQILLIAQKSPDVDDPGQADLYPVGTLATVLQLLKLPTAPSRCWSRACRASRSRASATRRAR
jgi:ATP-dependent Lon protease